MRELGITATELVDKTGVPYTTVKYFGMLPHDRETLERLSMALDWPPQHLWDLSGMDERESRTSRDGVERP